MVKTEAQIMKVLRSPVSDPAALAQGQREAGARQVGQRLPEGSVGAALGSVPPTPTRGEKQKLGTLTVAW